MKSVDNPKNVNLKKSLLYLSVTLYTPSLALSTVIDEDINKILVCLFAIATVMTVLGGMKAVLLTDVLFGAIMLFGQVSILAESFLHLSEDQLEAYVSRNVSVSPSIWDIQNQYSFWDLTIGGFFMCLYLYGANQASVHRYLSANSTKSAKLSLWFTAFALEIILAIGLGFGYLLKVHYENMPEEIQSPDQLLMFYVFSRYR